MLASEIVAVIEEKLKKKGIKKQDFYNACGISAAMMSNWRHDKNYPLLDTLVKINGFLGTNLVLTGDQKEAPDAQGDGRMMPEEFTARYWALSEQSRAELDRYAQFLQEREKEAAETRGKA